MPTSLPSSLAIQSWCFRGVKDHPSVIKWLKACGVSNIEMCGFHLDPNLPTDYSDTLALYKDAGITISAYGVCWIDKDESKSRKVFEFAQKVGFNALSVDFREDALPTAEKLCAEFNKKIGIHNHGRKHVLGSPWAIEAILKKSSPNIGLYLDTAWMLDQGADPIEIAKKFRDRLHGIHIKDFVFTREGKPEDVVVGTGNLKLDDLTKFLVDTNWSGALTLEYEGDVQNPVPALSECVKAIHKSFEKAGAK